MLNAMQGAYVVGKWIATDGKGSNGGLISGTVQAGVNVSKSKSESSQSQVVGSTATAGNNLNIVARGDNVNDAHNGDLTATAANLADKDVTLSGNNVTLQSGWDTTHDRSKSKSVGGNIGYEFSEKGGISFGASGQSSSQHVNGDSATGVDTTVSATGNLTIKAPGKTTLNGAQVSGNHVTVDTGNLDITSPLNTSTYNSNATQGGMQASIGLPTGSGWSAGGSMATRRSRITTKARGMIFLDYMLVMGD